MVASVILVALLGAPNASASAPIPWLELQPIEPKVRSVSLLSETTLDIPAVLEQAMLGDIRIAMAEEMTRFANELLPEGRPVDAAGSGDDSGSLALIAGILGFFPGFGLGHLITGNLGGFLLFLVIDLVIVGVFFVVFPVVFFPYWYLASIIVIVIERVVEAFSAANSATRAHYADTDWVPPGGPEQNLPRVKPAFTLLNF